MASAKGSRMNAERGTETILITGATDGLGRAAALLLAERGYRVFAAGRSVEKRVQLDTLAKEKRLPLETLEMDVADDRSVERAVAVVHQKTGQIDVLINNAGLAYFATVEDMNMEDWFRCRTRDPGGAGENAGAALRPHHHDQFGLRSGDPAGARRL